MSAQSLAMGRAVVMSLLLVALLLPTAAALDATVEYGAVQDVRLAEVGDLDWMVFTIDWSDPRQGIAPYDEKRGADLIHPPRCRLNDGVTASVNTGGAASAPATASPP